MYKKFMKHAKKIAKDLSSEQNRPVLNGVCHYEEGDLAATNSHVLYYGKGLHELDVETGTVITPDGEKLDHKYPDVNRLMYSDLPDTVATIPVNEFIKGIDIVHVAGRVTKSDSVMKYEGNTITVSQPPELEARYQLPIEVPGGSKFHSNAAYWLDALRMFKDFGYKEISFNYYSPMRPFTLISPDEKITALILPVRSY